MMDINNNFSCQSDQEQRNALMRAHDELAAAQDEQNALRTNMEHIHEQFAEREGNLLNAMSSADRVCYN